MISWYVSHCRLTINEGSGESTLVNVYVDLLVFTRIARTSKTQGGRYWCKYYTKKHVICLKDYKIRSFCSIQYVHGDLCKHLGIDLSTDLVLESIPKCLHKSPCACQILKNDLIL